MIQLPKAPTREPFAWELSRPLVLPLLPALRREKSRRRAHQMCEGVQHVLGIQVLPMTLPTYSLLLAHDSPFLIGGNARERDVRNYIWFHSPQYTDSTNPRWEKIKKQALRSLTFQLTSPWRKWLRLGPDITRYAAALSMAIADIRGLVEFDFAEAGGGRGQPGAPCASLHAQMINSFTQTYHWSREEIERVPLRILFQLDRALAASRGVKLTEADEDNMLADHLLRRQAEIDAARRNTEGAET